MLTSISLMLFGTCVAVDGDSVYDITIVSEVAAKILAEYIKKIKLGSIFLEGFRRVQLGRQIVNLSVKNSGY